MNTKLDNDSLSLKLNLFELLIYICQDFQKLLNHTTSMPSQQDLTIYCLYYFISFSVVHVSIFQKYK